MITHIATIGVYVEDQNKTESFWVNKVGFEIKKKVQMEKDAHWLELGPQDGQSYLAVYPKSMMKNWEELKPSIVFHCTDVNETYKRMADNGVEFTEKPKKMSWGIYAQFKDLDNNEYLLKG